MLYRILDWLGWLTLRAKGTDRQSLRTFALPGYRVFRNYLPQQIIPMQTPKTKIFELYQFYCCFNLKLLSFGVIHL